MGKSLLVSALTLIALSASSVSAFSTDRPGTISGYVADSEGAAIEGASVMILNTDTQVSQLLKSGKAGDFKLEDLLAGTYTVDAWYKFFERSSQTVVITSRSRKKVYFKLDLCGMRHLDTKRQNFAIVRDIKAASAFEKELAKKAQALPCPSNPNTTFVWRSAPPHCANSATMDFYSAQVKRNQAGHLPEDGEGTVEAGAYFSVTVEFDPTSKSWKAALRLEYKVFCGMLCGIYSTFDRRVYFDENGAVTKVDDDCGCQMEAIS